ncbi:MAG: ATP-binding protein [Pseudomonadota bacterium]
MKYSSVVVFIFLAILVAFFESRPEIGEELDLIAFRMRAQLHFSTPSDRLIVVKLKKEESNVTSSIIDAFSKLKTKNISAAVFFVQGREISASKHDLDRLSETLTSKKNLFLGLIGSMNDDSLFRSVSAPVLPQLRAAQTSREYNRDTIVAVPLTDQLSGKSYSTLAPAVAGAALEKEAAQRLQERISSVTADYIWNSAKFEEGSREFNPRLPELKLNYFRPNLLHEVPLESLAELDLTKKIVIFYFDNYRKRIPGGPEATFGNTPFQDSDGSNELGSSGTPVPLIQAVAIDNLLHEKSLVPISSLISWAFLLIICIGAYRVWSFPPVAAVIISLGVFVSIIGTTALLESTLGFEVPMARVTVYGIIFSAIGAFNSTTRVIASNLKSRIEIKAHDNLSKLHERFLDQFSRRLMNQTSHILDSAKSATSDISAENLEFLKDLVSSGEELIEYLKNINTLVTLNKNSPGLTHFKLVRIVPILEKLTSQIGASQKGIEVKINLKDQTMIKSDEVYLEPILFNLLSNAIKYSPANSKVTIFSFQNTEVIQSLVIRDEGPGIHDDFKEKIFEKFYRIKDDRAFTVKGTGLGLYLSKFFADALALKIDVRDGPEKGTDFILRVIRK